MRIIKICVLTTVVYFITYMLSARVFTFITHQPIDLARASSSGLFIGICLIVIPYIVNGYCCRKMFSNPFKGVLITSVILVISERILILIIGSMLVLSGGDGTMDGITVMMFIQGEAAPYFTISYIVMGVFSVCISMLVSLFRNPYSLKSA